MKGKEVKTTMCVHVDTHKTTWIKQVHFVTTCPPDIFLPHPQDRRAKSSFYYLSPMKALTLFVQQKHHQVSVVVDVWSLLMCDPQTSVQSILLHPSPHAADDNSFPRKNSESKSNLRCFCTNATWWCHPVKCRAQANTFAAVVLMSQNNCGNKSTHTATACKALSI